MPNGGGGSTATGLTRKQGIGIIFALTVISALALHLIEGGGFDLIEGLPRLAGIVSAMFVLSGLIPCLGWAVLKFRASSLRTVMGIWIILLLIWTYLNYLGGTASLPQ